MRGALQALKQEFGGLRTGRASTSLLDPITVDAYGQIMPINQVGTVGVPEPRMLTIQVWDKGLVSAVDKAIRNSGLGLNPNVDGTLIRLPIPELNQERRQELSKIAAKYSEQARIAVRKGRYLRDFAFEIHESKPFPASAPIDLDATGASLPRVPSEEEVDAVRRQLQASRGDRGALAERYRRPLQAEYAALRYARRSANERVPLERAGVRIGMHAKSLVVDERVGEEFRPDAGDVERLMYGWSVLHCLPSGMTCDGVGTGTVMRPATLRRYARAAGFKEIETLPVDHIFFRFYRLVF